MNCDLDKAPYPRSFDQPQWCATGRLPLEPSLTATHRDSVIDGERRIGEGFRSAPTKRAPLDAASVLLGGNFGAATCTGAALQMVGRLRESVDLFDAGRLPHPAGTS